MEALIDGLWYFTTVSQDPSVQAMNAEFDLQSRYHLQNNPKHLEMIQKEFKKFTGTQNYWYPKCLTLPTQSERMAFVIEAVLQRITHNDFDQGAFVAEYKESYCEAFSQGVDGVKERGGTSWPRPVLLRSDMSRLRK